MGGFRGLIPLKQSTNPSKCNIKHHTLVEFGQLSEF